MRDRTVSIKTRIAATGAFALAAALIATPMLGADTTPRETSRAVGQALLRLPYYGVFDFLAFKVDKNVVTLVGNAYRGSLKQEAQEAVKRIPGVDEVANKIEVLPSYQDDDRIRWATFYNIYTDDFLSRYAPGRGPLTARYEALSFARFPGMQPYGMYPIHILVKNGRTTLIGVVDNEGDKIIASIRAREVPRIFSVENELVVSKK